MCRNLLIIILLLLATETNAQLHSDPQVDSLLGVLEAELTDLERADVLTNLSHSYKRINVDTSLYYAEMSIGYAKKAKNDLQMANSLNALGNAYTSKGQLGLALTVFLEALEFANQANDNSKMARINNNIGIIYYNQGDLDEALDYFQTTASIMIDIGDTSAAIFAFNNIGGIYNDQGKQAEALAYYERGYNLSISSGYEFGESILLAGVATVYASMGELDVALEKHVEALELKRKFGNKSSIIYSLSDIAEIHILNGDHHKALMNYNELADLAEETGQSGKLKDVNLSMAYSLAELGQYQLAYEHLLKGEALEDSLVSVAENEKVAEIESKYNKAQDAKKIELLEKTEQIRQAEIERKELWNVLLIGGGVLILILALLIYSRLRTSRTQNRIIQQQKKLVDEKNKEVFDSITYAQRIQQAMLKSEISQTGDRFEHFVLFKPKDIVSGDFYWVEAKKNAVYVGAVDCTGHGVPGAFLTLLGTAFLNEIVASDEELSPAEILNQLRNRIINELGQAEEGGGKDGMDMSLVKLSKDGASAEWAGANNPLWILRNGASEIEEIKADKEHIGYSYKMSPFTNHQVNLNKGDMLYLFSDGFSDQFGGLNQGNQKEKKFKTSQLKKLIISSATMDMQAQMKRYDQALMDWMGDIEQLDDVCLIGIKI